MPKVKPFDPFDNYNYAILLNYCVERWAPITEYFIVVVTHGKKLKILVAKGKKPSYSVVYYCVTTKPLNHFIFFPFKNYQFFLFALKDGEDNYSLIPNHLLPGEEYTFGKRYKGIFKVHQFVVDEIKTFYFPYDYFSTKSRFDFHNTFDDLNYQNNPSPRFCANPSNLEAFFYYAINTLEPFFGEIIAILFPFQKNKTYIYFFRRVLLGYILERVDEQPNDFNFNRKFLQYSYATWVVFNNEKDREKASDLNIDTDWRNGYREVNISETDIGNGCRYYEKAKDEKALAIFATPIYVRSLKKAISRNLVKIRYKNKHKETNVVENEKLPTAVHNRATFNSFKSIFYFLIVPCIFV